MVRLFGVYGLSALASMFAFADGAQAQSCMNIARGAVPACGTAPGYFRPQSWTLSPQFVPQRAPQGSYYAPLGANGQNWQQYQAPTRTYGPVEPNPYGQNGYLSPPRVINHVYTTRVQPRIVREFPHR